MYKEEKNWSWLMNDKKSLLSLLRDNFFSSIEITTKCFSILTAAETMTTIPTKENAIRFLCYSKTRNNESREYIRKQKAKHKWHSANASYANQWENETIITIINEIVTEKGGKTIKRSSPVRWTRYNSRVQLELWYELMETLAHSSQIH